MPEGRKHGVRHGLLNEEQQIGWLHRKAKQAGFLVHSIVVTPEGSVSFVKADGGKQYRLSLLSVRFDGLLEVTHPQRLRETLAKGIGSAKGFGFGLLSLARTAR